MATQINLSPSSDNRVLVKAIKNANAENQKIVLLPGIHLTQPNHSEEITINENGLRIKGTLNATNPSIIMRPDNAINKDAADNNYGLFFIPSAPTENEIANIKEADWQTYEPGPADAEDAKPFEYVVLIRGDIKIENLELNCNMGNQQLPEKLPEGMKIEHSAMLGFAGRNKIKHPRFDDRFVYVSFRSVTLNNIRVRRGGYADDIWISRGYHRPNIEKVMISNITSDIDNPVRPEPRINRKRSTITFSGLTENVVITNARICSLQAEETTRKHWRDLPGKETQFSQWKVSNVTCDVLDLAAKGKAIFLKADNVITRKLTLFYQIGGVIKNCNFKVPSPPQAVRFDRLNDLVFSKVNWLFEANKENEEVSGIAMVADDESCSAKFDRNTFKVEGPFKGGRFIVSAFSGATPANNVKLAFINCTYDAAIQSAKMQVAKVRERGNWQFTVADFKGLPADNVLDIKKEAKRKLALGVLEITIV